MVSRACGDDDDNECDEFAHVVCSPLGVVYGNFIFDLNAKPQRRGEVMVGVCFSVF